MRRKAMFFSAVAVLVLAAVAVIVPVVINTRMEQRDALTVYCLAPQQREELSAAGESLRLAVPTDLARWRDSGPDDFWRACEALSAARQAPGPGVFAAVLPILTALLGALLAFAAAAWRDRVTHNHELAKELRDTVTEFQRVLVGHLADWRPNKPDTSVVTARAALEVSVARVRAAHPEWHLVSAVTTSLAVTELEQIEVDKIRNDIFRIAEYVTHPVRAAMVSAK